MIKKLRKKFIFISLLSVFIVLFLTIGGINSYNYIKIEKESNAYLDILLENESIAFEDKMPENMPPEERKMPTDRLMRQQYFMVVIDENGNISKQSFQHIFAISEEKGKELAIQVYNSSKTKGTIDFLKYKVAIKNNNTYIAFVDNKEKKDSFNTFLVTSFTISLFSYIVLSILIILVSKIVYKTSEESYQKQKRFITNASHELKTPLTIISTDVDIIEMDNGKSEWTDSIKDQIKRLTTTTNQLVTLSRLEEDNINNFPFEEFNLSNSLNDLLSNFSQSFTKNGLVFNSLVKENIMFKANKYLIDELFCIFLDNALKYTKPNGTINLSLNNNKGKIEILIDNDIENDDFDLNLLFERFYRLENEKKDGSGIGLSIAKEIIVLHRGKIKTWLENKKINFLIIF